MLNMKDLCSISCRACSLHFILKKYTNFDADPKELKNGVALHFYSSRHQFRKLMTSDLSNVIFYNCNSCLLNLIRKFDIFSLKIVFFKLNTSVARNCANNITLNS